MANDHCLLVRPIVINLFLPTKDTLYTLIKLSNDILESELRIETQEIMFVRKFDQTEIRENINSKYIPEYRFAVLFPEAPSFLVYLFSIILFV